MGNPLSPPDEIKFFAVVIEGEPARGRRTLCRRANPLVQLGLSGPSMPIGHVGILYICRSKSPLLLYSALISLLVFGGLQFAWPIATISPSQR